MTIFASTPNTAGIIVAVIIIALLLIGIGILLWFFLFSRLRIQKQGRNINSRFEQMHALLFGDTLSYIRRLEAISTVNLIYVEDFMNWQSRFKAIRDSVDASAQATSNSVKDLLSERRYKDLKEYLPTAKKTIEGYALQVEELYNSLKEKFRTEENVHNLSIKCKEELRQVKSSYYSKQADISILSSSFDTLFKKINDLIVAADSDIENAKYEEAESIYRDKIDPVVKSTGEVLGYLPSICLQITSVIPDKISSLSSKYDELTKEGYPLNHIMLKTTVSALKEELSKITAQVKTLNIKGVEERFDSIRDRISSYEEAFEKEIEARGIFQKENGNTSSIGNNVTNSYIDLVYAIPKIKAIYLLDDVDESKLTNIKDLVDKTSASKRTLDTYIHSGTKQPYTVLVERMDTLKRQTKETSEAIKEFRDYLQSLKEDSEKAAKSVASYHQQIKDVEVDLRSFKLPMISAKYNPLVEEAFATADELYMLLRTAPIDVKKVNQCSASLMEKADALINDIRFIKKKTKEAEEAIVKANRYRANDAVINDSLSQAETLFQNGSFDEAITIAKKIVDSNSGAYSSHRK